MKGKLGLAAGIGIGYLMGSQRNREKVARQVRAVWGNPTVQQQLSHAQEVVREQAPVVQDQLTTAARKVRDKASATVGGGSSSGANGTSSGYAPAP